MIVRCWVENMVAVLDLYQRYNGFLLVHSIFQFVTCEHVMVLDRLKEGLGKFGSVI